MKGNASVCKFFYITLLQDGAEDGVAIAVEAQGSQVLKLTRVSLRSPRLHSLHSLRSSRLRLLILPHRQDIQSKQMALLPPDRMRAMGQPGRQEGLDTIEALSAAIGGPPKKT